MIKTNKGENIIVFKTYNNLFEVELDKEILDEEGFDYFLSDENMSNAFPIASDDVGRIRLHIFEKDIDAIKELINLENDNIIDEEDAN